MSRRRIRLVGSSNPFAIAWGMRRMADYMRMGRILGTVRIQNVMIVCCARGAFAISDPFR